MGFFIAVTSSVLAQIGKIAYGYNPANKNKLGHNKVHNEETFKNLEASLAALKEIIGQQRTVIHSVQHERDLLAAGYLEAIKECENLKALLNASNDSGTFSSSHG